MRVLLVEDDRTSATAVTLKSNSNRDEAGFTLLELLVVVAILGVLVAIAAPATFKILGRAKTSVATQEVDALGSQLDMYRLDQGNLPTQEQGLTSLWTKPSGAESWGGPYIKNVASLKDPWNHDWVYIVPSRRENHDYDLCSSGSDGKGTGPGDSGAICNP